MGVSLGPYESQEISLDGDETIEELKYRLRELESQLDQIQDDMDEIVDRIDQLGG